jgi:protein tyrosine phosphatase
MQLKGWDDNEAPHHESVNALNRLLKMALELTLSKTQMLFHCSAGVGRTGTFLALLNLKAMIHRQFTEAGDGTGETLLDTLELSIFNTVRRLREQRWGMVYRREQYIFIYNYMLQEIEALEKSKTMH